MIYGQLVSLRWLFSFENFKQKIKLSGWVHRSPMKQKQMEVEEKKLPFARGFGERRGSRRDSNPRPNKQ